jgi:hypothetical protein
MASYRLKESCQVLQERAHTRFLIHHPVRPVSFLPILTPVTH